MWSQAELLVSDPLRKLFAVVDGAAFDDLPSALAEAGIAHRSLYRSIQDVELIRSGPWLIDPYSVPDPSANVWGGFPSSTAADAPIEADTHLALLHQDKKANTLSQPFHAKGEMADPSVQIARLGELIGASQAAVLWLGDASLSEERLWKHVRTLNMVLVPKPFLPDGPDKHPPAANEDEGPTHEAVLFRHFDGNVLAEVLPVLDAAQFARVFGPANAMIFHAPDHPAADGSPVRRALLPQNGPPPPPGLLHLTDEQMEAIEFAGNEVTRRETAEYLRDVAREDVSNLSDRELEDTVAKIERQGLRLGFESMGAHCLFAFLSVTGVVAAIGMAAFSEIITESGMNPDDALDEFYAGLEQGAAADIEEMA
jgi:hypothetical protein